MQPDRVTTPIGEMWLDDRGLLWHRIEALVVTEQDAAAVRQAVAEVTGGRRVPALVDMRRVAYADADARKLFAASADEAFELATALLVDSRSSSAMADLFLRFTKPRRPVRIFTDESEAIQWAAGFLASEGG